MNQKKLRRLYHEEQLQVRRRGGRKRALGTRRPMAENQFRLVRERFFAPWLRVKSYDELNDWLLDQVLRYAKAHRHPEQRGSAI